MVGMQSKIFIQRSITRGRLLLLSRQPKTRFLEGSLLSVGINQAHTKLIRMRLYSLSTWPGNTGSIKALIVGMLFIVIRLIYLILEITAYMCQIMQMWLLLAMFLGLRYIRQLSNIQMGKVYSTMVNITSRQLRWKYIRLHLLEKLF